MVNKFVFEVKWCSGFLEFKEPKATFNSRIFGNP